MHVMCLSIPLPGSGSPCIPGSPGTPFGGRRCELSAQHLTPLPASSLCTAEKGTAAAPGARGGGSMMLQGSGADLGLFHHLNPLGAYRGAHPPLCPQLLPLSCRPASPWVPPGPRGRVTSRCSQYVTAHICPLPTGPGQLPWPRGQRALGVMLRDAGALAAARLQRSAGAWEAAGAEPGSLLLHPRGPATKGERQDTR